MPGYIGGDRTNKKTERRGQVVQPHRGGRAQLEADLRAAVDIYNDRPQSKGSRLDGASPREMLERKWQAAGIGPRIPDAESFDLIFSKSVSRTVQKGMITIGGQTYEGACIDTLPAGEHVQVLIPLRPNVGRVFVRWHNRGLGWVDERKRPVSLLCRA